MSRTIHGYLDLRELARQEATLSEALPLSDFQRVCSLAAGSGDSQGGPIQLDLQLSQAHGLVMLTGEISGSVNLVCQRCMEAMALSLDGPMRLAVSEANEEAAGESGGLPEGCDVVSLPEAEELGDSLDRVRILPLVEDELLLRIPLVPMHGEGAECAGRVASEPEPEVVPPTEETTRPFSGLADLMAAKGKGH